MKYYAVVAGHVPGIYSSWDECKANTLHYSGAVYKSFETDGPQTAVVGADPEPETVPEVMPGQKIDRDQDSRLTLAQRIRVLFTGRL